MTGLTASLAELGWQPFFSRQLSTEEAAEAVPGRVLGLQRRQLSVAVDGATVEVTLGGRWYQLGAEERPTIGDWVLLDATATVVLRLLERSSLLKRVAAGREREVQPMAANVDVLFVVSACNDEFNPSRLERYLALALDAGVEPVVVLTKADQAETPDAFVDAVRALKRDIVVELVDARDPDSLGGVRAWCAPGRTVALLGSSGVGKSTLVNSLCGVEAQATGAARADDDKGRHTTTGRSLHRLPDGGLLVDNPGMRELALAEVDAGAAAALFADVEALAARCRFRDCEHESEPGCAVRDALAAGELDPRRVDSYRKMRREDARSRETLAESRARFRQFGRHVRQVQKDKHRRDP
ncbi:MAG: ribosome small subunit-dependent GTPase A [Pseudomonadales bacterium]